MNTDPMGRLVDMLDKRYERNRTPVMDAIIDSVTRNSSFQVVGATARIQGQSGVPVQIGANMTTLAPGQMFAAENLGTAAAPLWSLRGIAVGGNVAVPRVVEFSESVGGYAGGDLLLGSDEDFMPNFFFDESAGTFTGRLGNVETLGLNALTSEVFVGRKDYGHVLITANGLELRYNADNPAFKVQDTGLSMYDTITQRMQINNTGSGWLVSPEKFSWDTVGNIALAGNIHASTLSIGENQLGPAIIGGPNSDFDDTGMPLSNQEQIALGIIDGSGLPRIKIVTGTVAHPDTAAIFIGRETDPSYLWFEGGELKLVGNADITSGAIGGFNLTSARVASKSGLLILSNQNDETLKEGLHLTAGLGIVGWRNTADDVDLTNYRGFVTTERVADRFGGIGVRVSATDDSEDGWPTRVQLEAHNPMNQYNEMAKFTLWNEPEYNKIYAELNGYLSATGITLNTNGTGATALKVQGIEEYSYLGAADAVPYLNNGTAIRFANDGSGIECASGGLPMFFKLDIPYKYGDAEVNPKRITMYWKKILTAAYITSAALIQTNTDGTYSQIVMMSNLGQGVTAPMTYATQLLQATPVWPAGKTPAARYIKLTLSGVSDYGHIKVFGFDVVWGN